MLMTSDPRSAEVQRLIQQVDAQVLSAVGSRMLMTDGPATNRPVANEQVALTGAGHARRK